MDKNLFEQILTSPFLFFFDSNRRLYWVYLLVSLIVFTLFVVKKNLVPELKKSLQHKDSMLLDIKFWLFNMTLRVVISSLGLLTVAGVSLYFMGQLYAMLPNWSPIETTYHNVAILLTITSFIFFDFLRFFQHYLAHKVPLLWAFHQVHHSATYLTPFTLYRIHPVENILSAFRRVFGQSFLFSIFMFLFGSNVNAYDILGVNALSFVANLAVSNLRHSPIAIGFGKLEWIFLSPAQHQLHHSSNPHLMHSNYGVVLSVWDHLFKSFVKYSGQEMKWGIKNTKLQQHSLSQQLFIPFTLGFQIIKYFAIRVKTYVNQMGFNFIKLTHSHNKKEGVLK